MSIIKGMGFLRGKQREEFGYSRPRQVRGVDSSAPKDGGGLKGLRKYARGQRVSSGARAHYHGHQMTVAAKEAQRRRRWNAHCVAKRHAARKSAVAA